MSSLPLSGSNPLGFVGVLPSSEAAADAVPASRTVQPRLFSGPGLQLAVGLLAGMLVWAVHPPQTSLVPIPRELRAVSMREVQRNPDLMRVLRRWEWSNCCATVALIGLMASGAFGLVEGASRRSWRGAGVGLFVGMLAGGLAGAGMGLLGRYVWQLVEHQLEDLQRGILLQAIMWTAVGLAAGACMALPTRRAIVAWRCALACALAGLISALVFGVLAASIFPLDSTEQLVPQGDARILWTMLTTGLMGLIGGWHGAKGQ
ncbi:MAG: hypothetical protein AB7O62_06790 [Pirellulales bacterium]